MLRLVWDRRPRRSMRCRRDRMTAPMRGMAISCGLLLSCLGMAQPPAADISRLSQHFNDPAAQLGPWQFTPQANVTLNPKKIPGVLVLRQNGKGQDVKGILDKPIGLADYPTPWYFQLAMLQDNDALAGHVGSPTQVNYAIGLNLAITFSDPATWPADRRQRPPDTHDVQLFVVHIGASGEVTEGLPQYTTEMHPERFLVWGRGDLGYSTMGDWRIPTMQIGNGMKAGGPANAQVFFQCRVDSPTRIGIGVKFDPKYDYQMRWIDFAQIHGPATGIWEIGPIVSGDRWIPDVLCRSIALERGPEPFTLGRQPGDDHATWVAIPQPRPEPPLKNLNYLVDYCVFGSFAANRLESFSDEFDNVGYMDKGRFQLYGSMIDTHSHPGWLTVTKMGPSLECWAWATPGEMDLDEFRPPWEIEACIMPPDDQYNWDFDLGFALYDKENKPICSWYPGVRNLPVSRRHEVASIYGEGVGIEFDPPLPEAVIGAKPIYMLVQFIDKNQVRLGFKAKPEDPWRLSKICNVNRKFGRSMQRLVFIAWNAGSANIPPSEYVGTPLVTSSSVAPTVAITTASPMSSATVAG